MDQPGKPVYVTQPYLLPLVEFIPHLEEIWKNKWLTNAGPFHNQLEAGLVRYLEVPQLSLFCNGTIALVVALQALRISGEVITTPALGGLVDIIFLIRHVRRDSVKEKWRLYALLRMT